MSPRNDKNREAIGTHYVEDMIFPVQLSLTGHLIAFDIYDRLKTESLWGIRGFFVVFWGI